MADKGNGITLRLYLREATSKAHDALDAAARVGDFSSRLDYTNFLTRQLRARLPIENFIIDNCYTEQAPPLASPLIRRDLDALNTSSRVEAASFAMPEGADPVGLYWALAGSHLGNRAMRAQLGNTRLPTAFLDDQAMAAFWKEFRLRIERQVTRDEAEAAALAANAAFETFLEAFCVSQAASDRRAA